MNEQTIGIQNIGYTNDGLVFFELVTTYKEESLSTTVQMKPDTAVMFARSIMEASTKAREAIDVGNSLNLN